MKQRVKPMAERLSIESVISGGATICLVLPRVKWNELFHTI